MNGSLNLHPKVAASLLASAVVIVVVYSLHQWAGVELPVEVGGALTTIVAFVAGWLAPGQVDASTPK
jgi:hypothetical protein